jgi:hypothetical protein
MVHLKLLVTSFDQLAALLELLLPTWKIQLDTTIDSHVIKISGYLLDCRRLDSVWYRSSV